MKAGESGIDFGWNAYEGTESRSKPSLHPDPRFPIHQYTHAGDNRSVTGGYVYRGPIEDLQGEYFFADFNTANVWSGIFDRETNPATFNGMNFSVTSRTAELNQGIIGGGQLHHIVSFGEDLEGNLLLVDYGQGNLFNPTPNTGVIYKLVEVEELIPGDLNNDDVVDLEDWALMKDGFITDLTGLTPTERFLTGDLNWDGVINLSDFNLFADAFAGGADALGFPVPEPATACLFGSVLMAAACCRARRRFT